MVTCKALLKLSLEMPTVAVLPPRNQALRGGVTTGLGDILKEQSQGINPVYLPLVFFMVPL